MAQHMGTAVLSAAKYLTDTHDSFKEPCFWSVTEHQTVFNAPSEHFCILTLFFLSQVINICNKCH